MNEKSIEITPEYAKNLVGFKFKIKIVGKNVVLSFPLPSAHEARNSIINLQAQQELQTQTERGCCYWRKSSKHL